MLDKDESVFRSVLILAVVVVVIILAASCLNDFGVGVEDGHGEVHREITDGVQEPGYPAVGVVSSICTGTLVGERSVITARHCLRSRNWLRLEGVLYYGSSAYAHPVHDIAVFMLTNAPPIDPIPVRTTDVMEGQQIKLIGYGVTGDRRRDFGTKRSGYNVIDTVIDRSIAYAGTGNGRSNVCFGDSGGPALINEALVAVTSRGRIPCGTYAYSDRVDNVTEWLLHVTGGDLAVAGTTPVPPPGAQCDDDAGYRDAQGYQCKDWKKYNCRTAHPNWGYTPAEEADIIRRCPGSCGVCLEDTPGYVDHMQHPCSDWEDLDCREGQPPWLERRYKKKQRKSVQKNCQYSCGVRKKR